MSCTTKPKRSVFIKLICFHSPCQLIASALINPSGGQTVGRAVALAGTSNGRSVASAKTPGDFKLINEKCQQRVDLILIRAIRKKKKYEKSRNNQKIK